MKRIRKTAHTLAGIALAATPQASVLADKGVGASSSVPRHAAQSHGAESVATDGPADQGWPELRYSRDPHLHEALQKKIKDLDLARYAADNKLAVALVDITEPKNPRVATVNAHHMIYAASLPKIAILLGAFQKAADGEMKMDAETQELLTNMIRHSSNSAATIMLERVGYDYVADILQSDRYDLYDPDWNGGLWVGKPYAKKGAVKRDPLYNLSHAATPFSVARFYYMLATNQLVDAQACTTMMDMLSDPGINHKFVVGLNAHRPGSKIFRKSGTWRTYHSDSAIVERDGRRYIAVAMADHPSGGRWLSQLIVAMDDLIFDPANIAHDTMEHHNESIEAPRKIVASQKT